MAEVNSLIFKLLPKKSNLFGFNGTQVKGSFTWLEWKSTIRSVHSKPPNSAAVFNFRSQPNISKSRNNLFLNKHPKTMNFLQVIFVIGYAILLINSITVLCQEQKPQTTDEDSKKDVIDEDKENEEVTTHRPLFALPSFQIPIPQITFPQITLPQFHLPPLPQLHLPEVPSPFKRETITATRTIFIETTKKVTRHPICVTAYGPKPPCIEGHHQALRELENNLDEMYLEEKKPVIEPTKVVELSSVRSTAILEGTAESLPSENPAVAEALAEGRKRDGRYLVPHPQFRAETPQHQDSEKIVEGLLQNTHFITKTLYVTKIQKTLDHRVTATLVAKNCIPTEPRIPHCGPLYPIHEGAHVDWKDTTDDDEK